MSRRHTLDHLPAMNHPHRRQFLGRSLGAAHIAVASVLLPGAARAFAPATSAEARRLSFNHLHTQERTALVYALGDDFVPAALTRREMAALRQTYFGQERPAAVVESSLSAIELRAFALDWAIHEARLKAAGGQP